LSPPLHPLRAPQLSIFSFHSLRFTGVAYSTRYYVPCFAIQTTCTKFQLISQIREDSSELVPEAQLGEDLCEVFQCTETKFVR
jgi:hypothetical protein